MSYQCPGTIGERYLYATDPAWYQEVVRERRFKLERILQDSINLMERARCRAMTDEK